MSLGWTGCSSDGDDVSVVGYLAVCRCVSLNIEQARQQYRLG